ncbi:MAG: B12-binding domain-containing radical SAM protein [Labilithrix sp.]|nr:B12-binding domain-containing radical SAM protein [Labilithrix sp.]MCW5817778.1 B12-binding domain-containing radical SAM protein [Labilithrix sp.]
MKRITFVSTRKNLDPTERELYEMDLLCRGLGFKRAFLDLGMQTVMACTPADVHTELVDEYSDPIDYDVKTDLVALSAKTSCATYAYDVARRFKERGKRVVMGGIHASLRPDEALQHVDCVVTGEAETLWPEVVRDLQAGKLKERYDAIGFPPMDAIPAPAWGKGKPDDYLFHQIQTTRGCPFRCRFCSVPDISGQDFRFKPVECVLAELRALPKSKGPIASGKPLYVVDDNFISRTRYTKDLLRAMAPLAQRGEIPSWSAETTLNVASDEEMLDLFRDAGCSTLIIGFESVTEASLAAMDKPVNFCLTYQEAIDRIHARGMTIIGNFIVGFDTDTLGVFKQTLDFVQESGILYPFFSILTPMPGTKLFDDYKAAGRLDHEEWHLYDTRHVVFEPTNMTREELMDGYVWLYEQAYGADNLYARIERNWRRRARGSNLLEKAFIASRLAPEMLKGDHELRSHFGQGIKLMMNRHLKADAGQLLYLLDAFDFARFMRRFNTPRRAESYRTFEDPTKWTRALEAEKLDVRQWQNAKAVKRTAKASLPVVR